MRLERSKRERARIGEIHCCNGNTVAVNGPLYSPVVICHGLNRVIIPRKRRRDQQPLTPSSSPAGHACIAPTRLLVVGIRQVPKCMTHKFGLLFY